MIVMIINIDIVQIPYDVQMHFKISMHEIEPKALKAPLAAAMWFIYDL